MEILFRQGKSAENMAFSVLKAYGIEGCVLKQISFTRDRSRITKKSHYHTSFEIHVIERGHQVYDADGKAVRVTAGEFLILPPALPHTALDGDPKTEKLAFSFQLRAASPFALPHSAFHGLLPDRIWESIAVIKEEKQRCAPFHTAVTESRVWECILEIFRAAAPLRSLPEASAPEENERVLLVKQYIDDNVRRGISLSELASYACIGEKQLERLFQADVGMTVMGYVRKRRCREIETLLADPSLSLREISDTMHFSNEYHFSAYFKRYAGMPPGAYRKAVMK